MKEYVDERTTKSEAAMKEYVDERTTKSEVTMKEYVDERTTKSEAAMRSCTDSSIVSLRQHFNNRFDAMHRYIDKRFTESENMILREVDLIQEKTNEKFENLKLSTV